MHGSLSLQAGKEHRNGRYLAQLLFAAYISQLAKNSEMVYCRGRTWITAQPFVAPGGLPGAVRRRVPNGTESHTLRR